MENKLHTLIAKWKILMLQTPFAIIKWQVQHLKWKKQNVHH